MKFLPIVSGISLTLTCLLAVDEPISLNNEPLIGCSVWCQYLYPCLKYSGSSLLLMAALLFLKYCLKGRPKFVSNFVKRSVTVWLLDLLGVLCLSGRVVILFYLAPPATVDCTDCKEADINHISYRLFAAVIFGMIFILIHSLRIFLVMYNRIESCERKSGCRCTTEIYTCKVENV